MTEPMPRRGPSTTDQILDLLLDALAERQRGRGAEFSPSPLPLPPHEAEFAPSLMPSPSGERGAQPSPMPFPSSEKETEPSRRPSSTREREERRRVATLAEAAQREPAPLPIFPPRPGEKGWQPPARLPSIQMGRFLGRLAIAIALLVVAINIPIKRHGVSLARILPDSASLIIRDGLVLKGSGEKIYMLQDEQLRWISSMDVFEHLGLTWGDVREVNDKFLQQFEMGRPIYRILKCSGSPHIFALENGEKRWIRDIETFTSEGYVWEDVQFVDCNYLRKLPDGLPIPEDAGAPPQP